MNVQDMEKWIRGIIQRSHASRKERKRLGVDKHRLIRKNKELIRAFNEDLRDMLVPFYCGHLRVKGPTKIKRTLRDTYMVFDMYRKKWTWPTPHYQCAPSTCPRLAAFITKTGLDRTKMLTFIWANSPYCKTDEKVKEVLYAMHKIFAD